MTRKWENQKEKKKVVHMEDSFPSAGWCLGKLSSFRLENLGTRGAELSDLNREKRYLNVKIVAPAGN